MARSRRGRGEGGIGQQDGKWFVEISLGYNENGKRVRKRIYGDTKAEVQEELRKLQGLASKGKIPKAKSITMADLLDSWLEAKKVVWAAGTHEANSQHVRNHLKKPLGGVKVSQLAPLHVQSFQQSMQAREVSISMQRHVLISLRSALQYAIEMKIIHENVAKAVQLPPRSKHKSTGLSPEMITKFLTVAKDDRLFAMYVLAIDSGLRQGELLALTWADLDEERRTVTVSKSLEEVNGQLKLKVPKTQSSLRTVMLSEATLNALEAHRYAMKTQGFHGPEFPVFCGTRRGQWLRKSDIYRYSFAPILKAAKLKFRFHDLRHASASLLLFGGIDVKTVQHRLGHSTAAVTMDVYAYALDRAQKGAAATMDGILGKK